MPGHFLPCSHVHYTEATERSPKDRRSLYLSNCYALPPTGHPQHISLNPLNAELNPICHLLALLGGATIVDVSRLRVNSPKSVYKCVCNSYGSFACRISTEAVNSDALQRQCFGDNTGNVTYGSHSAWVEWRSVSVRRHSPASLAATFSWSNNGVL